MSDKINIHFLGTSASTPTKDRGLSSLLINYKGGNYLFDCSENTQRQILKINQSILKVKYIFFTHLHGDHFYGLFGLLSSMSLNKREEELFIVSPKSQLPYLKDVLDVLKINLTFKINFIEATPNKKINLKNIEISIIKLNHSIETFGYVFKIKDKVGKFDKKKAINLKIPEGPLYKKLEEGKTITVNGKKIKPAQVIDFNYKKKGSKIIYFTDTQVLKKSLKVLDSPDVLIHECTFSSIEKDKAKDLKHSFTEDVCNFAKKIKAKSLYLTHISSRYKSSDVHTKECRKIFKKVKVANDLDSIQINDY